MPDMDRSPADEPVEISVVIPVFDEQDSVSSLCDRLTTVLDSVSHSYEILLVDDGSRDQTAARIDARARTCPAIRLLRLSRNFGHQAALFAGLEHARGSAVISMDGDLQHPPELIAKLIEEWRGGAEVVQTIRRTPADNSVLKRSTSRWYYRVLSQLAQIQVTPGAADFRLLSRPALEAFLTCRERRRFNRGLVQWIGFDCVEVPYDADPRVAGRSKYSLRQMLRLAGDGVLSFSTAPLRIAGLAGAFVSMAAAAYLLFVLWARLFTDRVQPGWTSILAAVLVLGGLQLIVLWILGEYVGRLYEEVKQRPIYIARPPQRVTRGAGGAPDSAQADESPDEPMERESVDAQQ